MAWDEGGEDGLSPSSIPPSSRQEAGLDPLCSRPSRLAHLQTPYPAPVPLCRPLTLSNPAAGKLAGPTLKLSGPPSGQTPPPATGVEDRREGKRSLSSMPLHSKQEARPAHPQPPQTKTALLYNLCEVQVLLSRVLQQLRGKTSLALMTTAKVVLCHATGVSREEGIAFHPSLFILVATFLVYSQLLQGAVSLFRVLQLPRGPQAAVQTSHAPWPLAVTDPGTTRPLIQMCSIMETQTRTSPWSQGASPAVLVSLQFGLSSFSFSSVSQPPS